MIKTIHWYQRKAKKKKNAKTDFEKNLFKLMNNSVFEKTMENVRKHRDIKLVTTEERRNCLVSERNYHTTDLFFRKIISYRNKKNTTIQKKSVYLGLVSGLFSLF